MEHTQTTTDTTVTNNPASGLSTILLIFIIVGAVAYGAFFVLNERAHQSIINVEQDILETDATD